jgi:ribosomal protein L24
MNNRGFGVHNPVFVFAPGDAVGVYSGPMRGTIGRVVRLTRCFVVVRSREGVVFRTSRFRLEPVNPPSGRALEHAASA